MMQQYEVVGWDANGDDWTIATDSLVEAEDFVSIFLAEGLTHIRVSRIGRAESLSAK